MKFIVLTFCFFTGATALAGNISNLNKDGVILDGYDAVSYFKPNGPVKGSPQFQAKFGDATYWFANEQDKNDFTKEPQKYAPQFGAWCAYAVADSKSKVEVDTKSFLIQDGKLLLFYKGVFADTRKKWQNTNGKDPATYLKEAEANWPEVEKKNP